MVESSGVMLNDIVEANAYYVVFAITFFVSRPHMNKNSNEWAKLIICKFSFKYDFWNLKVVHVRPLPINRSDFICADNYIFWFDNLFNHFKVPRRRWSSMEGLSSKEWPHF